MSKLKIKERYGVAPNEILNNEKLSFKAKGLFTFLQSKPDGWKFSVDRIKNQSKDGKGSIQAGLKELEDFGYLERKPIRNKSGKWNGYDYILSVGLTKKPFTENRSTVNRSTENGATLSKKDNSNKDIVIKNIEFNIFWNLYDKKVGLKWKIESKWNKLTDKDRKDIINYIPKYIQAQPEKRFRKNPMTFLNNESWKDELISNEKPKVRRIYFQGSPVRVKADGSKWVIRDGEWLEFTGSDKDLEIKYE